MNKLFLCTRNIFKISQFKPILLNFSLFKNRLDIRQINSKTFEVDTNVVKDVILFKYENPKYFKLMNIFAISQFVFWTYLGIFSLTTLKDIPVSTTNKEGLPWWRKINFGEEKIRYTISFGCLAFAYTLLAGCWIYTLKSIRFLILMKGGKKLSLVTYTPYGHNRIITVPLEEVSCLNSRWEARVQMSLQLTKHRLNYMMDMRGTFTNPQLFDYTAGLKRNVKK